MQRGANHERMYGVAVPAAPSPRSNRASASRNSRSRTNGLCSRVFTLVSRQLNDAMSTPAESSPDSSACTSVVPEPGERIEDTATRRHVPAEQLLDELRDVLAEIWMEAVNVLRPIALGQVALRPREVEIQAGVELLLRRHRAGFDVG